MKIKHPFTCIVAGPTGSAKTSFVIKLLRNLESLCTESRFKGGIIWCYKEETAVPKQQLNKIGLISHIRRDYQNRTATPGVNRRLSF